MKKVAVYLLAVVSVFALAGCSGNKMNSTGDETSRSQAAISETVQIPSPWQSVKDGQEAEEIAGFTLEVPDAVKGYSQNLWQMMKSEEQPIVEVRYGEGDEDEVTIRKAPGEGDISGVYGDYEEKSMLVGKTEVSTRRTGDACVLANWCEDGYTYAVYIPDGMSETEMAALVAEIR